MFACAYVRVRVCVCARACMRVCVHVRVCVYGCMSVHVSMYVRRACMYTYMREYEINCVSTCIYNCLRVFVCVCLCAKECIYLVLCQCTNSHACMYVCLYVCTYSFSSIHVFSMWVYVCSCGGASRFVHMHVITSACIYLCV